MQGHDYIESTPYNRVLKAPHWCVELVFFAVPGPLNSVATAAAAAAIATNRYLEEKRQAMPGVKIVTEVEPVTMYFKAEVSSLRVSLHHGAVAYAAKPVLLGCWHCCSFLHKSSVRGTTKEGQIDILKKSCSEAIRASSQPISSHVLPQLEHHNCHLCISRLSRNHCMLMPAGFMCAPSVLFAYHRGTINNTLPGAGALAKHRTPQRDAQVGPHLACRSTLFSHLGCTVLALSGLGGIQHQ